MQEYLTRLQLHNEAQQLELSAVVKHREREREYKGRRRKADIAKHIFYTHRCNLSGAYINRFFPPICITSRGIIQVMHPRLQSAAELIRSNFLRFLMKICRTETATVIEWLKKWTAATDFDSLSHRVGTVLNAIWRGDGEGRGQAMEVYFTGSDRLFNRDLGLRSLNRRPAQTLSDCVAGTVSVLTSVSRLSDCLGWCAGRLHACWLTDCLMSLGGCLQIKRRDLDVKNTHSWLKLAFFF